MERSRENIIQVPSNFARCLQEKLGHCSGCGILEIITEKRRRLGGDQLTALVSRVNKTLCPEGNMMLILVVEEKRAEW